MDHGGEAFVGFLITRGDASEGLELTEEVFDQMAPAVHMEVAGDGLLAVCLGRDDRLRTAIVQLGAQPVDIEGLVGQERQDLDILDERLDADAVMTLTGQENEAGQIAERVDQGHDLARQAAARSADGLISSPPFAPVPCWWTRTIVPSMMAYSKSGSPDKLLKILSNTPFIAHLRKRLKTEFQCPNASCRSRHGDPYAQPKVSPQQTVRCRRPSAQGRRTYQEAAAQPAPIARRSKHFDPSLVSVFQP